MQGLHVLWNQHAGRKYGKAADGERTTAERKAGYQRTDEEKGAQVAGQAAVRPVPGAEVRV